MTESGVSVRDLLDRMVGQRAGRRLVGGTARVD
jgi:hypothetical protein